ncbi:MAG: glycosyltransferase family 2 protein [Candidatus Cloacimonadota bacterium]|nr:glycosyltransferase family 2 protein [Candidatus Cloacimonadota bacterium]
MDLSFIIPAQNEEKSLKILHEQIISNINNYSYEIIFLNDGSTDNTQEIMEEIAASDKNVKIVEFRRNFGKSAALQSGFDIAMGNIVFTMDADLQDDPAEIPNFIKRINEGFDLVAGWKQKRKDPLSKTIPSKLFNFVTSKLFKLKLHDYNCGFKAYRNEVVKSISIYGELHRYIPALAKAQGFSVCEIPIVHHKREFGKSKYGAKRLVRGFLDLLTVNMITKYARSPLYLFGLSGMIISFLGFATTIYLSIMKIFFGMSLSNRPLLVMGVLLIVVGIQLISIGLIGEFIVYLNNRKEPIRSKEQRVKD